MSLIRQHRNSLLLLLICLGTGLSYFSFFSNNYSANTKNKPPLLLSTFTSKGPLKRTLQVEINYDKVKTNSEVATIKAQVSIPFNYNYPLNYKWKLGEGVDLKEGSLTGQLSHLLSNSPAVIEIKVVGFSLQQNSHIGFEVIGVGQGSGIYGDSLVASDIENTFENTVQNVERLKAEEQE